MAFKMVITINLTKQYLRVYIVLEEHMFGDFAKFYNVIILNSVYTCRYVTILLLQYDFVVFTSLNNESK